MMLREVRLTALIVDGDQLSLGQEEDYLISRTVATAIGFRAVEFNSDYNISRAKLQTSIVVEQS